MGNYSSAIIRALAYYDMFRYPITKDEIADAMNLNNCESSQVAENIQHLLQDGYICQMDDFYALEENRDWVQRRVKGNQLAEQYFDKAKKMSEFMARFPYVRGIMLSGSLSKNFVDEKGDIDYFIVTKAQRLWIARTLLVLYKKIFLFNSKKYFCVNYFVDEDHVEIEEKNIFTATELSTLIPTYGAKQYQRLMDSNSWVQKYYPNRSRRELIAAHDEKNRPVKYLLEKVLNGRFGNWLDSFFMRNTVQHWQRKFNHFNPADFEVAMKSRKYVSKHHPNQFQKKVINRLTQRLSEFENKHQVNLS